LIVNGKIFFVLKGLIDGKDGEYATKADGERLPDGWYVLVDGEADPSDGPFDSEDDARTARFNMNRNAALGELRNQLDRVRSKYGLTKAQLQELIEELS